MPDDPSAKAGTTLEVVSPKRSYGRPTLRELGSLPELTQAAVGTGGGFDGSGYVS
jgi:hypothetical protein